MRKRARPSLVLIIEGLLSYFRRFKQPVSKELPPKVVSFDGDKLSRLGPDVKVRPYNYGWKHWTEFMGRQLTYPVLVLDTRDFHMNSILLNTPIPLSDKVLNHPDRYYFSVTELEQLIKRLYVDSGGEGYFRVLTLRNQYRTLNWELKYMHIYWYPYGYIVTNQDDFIFRKTDLNSPVNKEYLVHKKYDT